MTTLDYCAEACSTWKLRRGSESYTVAGAQAAKQTTDHELGGSLSTRRTMASHVNQLELSVSVTFSVNQFQGQQKVV